MSSIVAKYIYERITNNCSSRLFFDRIIFVAFYGLRKVLVKVFNPTIQMTVRGRDLWLPFSHNLPFNCAKYRYYDSLIERVSDFIRGKYPRLVYVDIGANIGDTIAFARKEDGSNADIFLGVEGDSYFASYFNKNMSGFSNVKLLAAVCSSSDKQRTYKSKVYRGSTATIAEDSSGALAKTLDSIVVENNEYEELNFLKIDTDGHDFEVLRGATNIIRNNMPAIMMELDIFNNENYIDDIKFLVDMLFGYGYRTMLLYDNVGYLFGKISLDDFKGLRYPLFYQLTSDFNFFDALIMKDEDIELFLSSDVKYYIDNMGNSVAMKKAAKALNL